MDSSGSPTYGDAEARRAEKYAKESMGASCIRLFRQLAGAGEMYVLLGKAWIAFDPGFDLVDRRIGTGAIQTCS